MTQLCPLQCTNHYPRPRTTVSNKSVFIFYGLVWTSLGDLE